MAQDCIFCKIIAGTIPSSFVHQDDEFVCIKDLRPQAKVHLLVLPKKHVASLEAAFPETGPDQSELIGKMFRFAAEVARNQGLLPSGFRSVINTGANAGQTVFHIHLHLLGGEGLGQFGS